MKHHNRVECAHCGEVIESKHRHDYATHRCPVAPPVLKRWWDKTVDPEVLREGPDTEPMSFAIDGGPDYMRRIGDPINWIERP